MQQSESYPISPFRTAPLDVEKWRHIVDDWDSSKENQKDYCQRLGVSLNTFSYMRNKLTNKKKSSSKFIPITLTNHSEPSITSNLITLENPSGFKLHFSPNLPLDQLSKIFKLSGWKND